MFQRNFSTKGPGRGVGTYSVRLLTERYLGGQVSLLSSPESGTRFGLSFAKHDANGRALEVGTAHPLPGALTAEPFPNSRPDPLPAPAEPVKPAFCPKATA
jgi:hypothetical protein